MKDYWNIKNVSKKPRYTPFVIPMKPMSFGDKPPVPSNPNKNLTTKQAFKMYKLAPLGNWDGDKHVNMFDCRPFDSTRHKVKEGTSRKRVKSHFFEQYGWSPYATQTRKEPTYGSVFREAEEQIPEAYNRGGEKEYKYSELLQDALENRKKYIDNPVKDIVGVYKFKKVKLGIHQTTLALHYIHRYLENEHPDYEFGYSLKDPKHVTVTYPDGRVEENRKISSYFNKKTPPYVRNLLTLLNPYADITIVITDYPTDILRASTGQGWTSCVAIRPDNPAMYEKGTFSDIKHGNVIAWVFVGNKIPGQSAPSGRIFLRWGVEPNTGKKDIAIEYNPRSDDPRGFYGITNQSARSIVRKIQGILQKKGYNTYNYMETPYQHVGYSDACPSRYGRLYYKKMPLQRTKNLPIYEIEEQFVYSPKKIPSSIQMGFIKKYYERPSRMEQISVRPELSKSAVNELAQHPFGRVRKNIVRHQKYLPKQAKKYFLMHEEDSDVIDILAMRKDLEPEERIEIFRRHPHTQSLYIQNTGIVEPVYMKFFIDEGDQDIINYLSRNHSLSPEAIEKVYNREMDEQNRHIITKILLQNQKIPPHIVNDIIDRYTNDEDILGSVIQTQSLTISQLKELFKKTERVVPFIYSPSLDEELVKMILKKSDYFTSQQYRIMLQAVHSKPLIKEILERYIMNTSDDETVSNTLNSYIGMIDFGVIFNLAKKYIEMKAEKGDEAYLVMDKFAQSHDIPDKYANQVYAYCFQEGDEQVHNYLLNNIHVNTEIKNLIRNKRGYTEY